MFTAKNSTKCVFGKARRPSMQLTQSRPSAGYRDTFSPFSIPSTSDTFGVLILGGASTRYPVSLRLSRSTDNWTIL